MNKTVFTNNPLNRTANLRNDVDWINSIKQDQKTNYIIFYNRIFVEFVLNKYFLFLQIPIGFCLYTIGQQLGVGGWALVLWGIPLRLVVVYHITWLVNSATHCWGKAPFDSGDSSKNLSLIHI